MSCTLEPGMRDRGEAGVERELERIAAEAAADLRLPHAADAGHALEDLRIPSHSPSGSKSGM